MTGLGAPTVVRCTREFIGDGNAPACLNRQQNDIEKDCAIDAFISAKLRLAGNRIAIPERYSAQQNSLIGIDDDIARTTLTRLL